MASWESSAHVSTLTRLIGSHRMAVVPVRSGPLAGRYSVAFDFFGRWQYLADEETGELRTWKSAYEAYHIGEASRQTINDLLEHAVAHRVPRARPRRT
jgi:hypothetical protein